MSCQILFSRKKIANLSSADSVHSMISDKLKVFDDKINNEHSSRCVFFLFFFFCFFCFVFFFVVVVFFCFLFLVFGFFWGVFFVCFFLLFFFIMRFFILLISP